MNISVSFGGETFKTTATGKTTAKGKKAIAESREYWGRSMSCPVVEAFETESEWAAARLMSGDLGVSSKALLAIGLGGEYSTRDIQYYTNGKDMGTHTQLVGESGMSVAPSDPADLGRCLRTFTCAPESAKERMRPALVGFIESVCGDIGGYSEWREDAEAVLNR